MPPFTRETAILKVRLAEDAWNSREQPLTGLHNQEVDLRVRPNAEGGSSGVQRPVGQRTDESQLPAAADIRRFDPSGSNQSLPAHWAAGR